MKILFMGRKSIAASALRWLAAQNDVQIIGVLTDHHLPVSPTAEAARALELPLFTLDEIQSRLVEDGWTFDLGLSLLYWRRIPPALIRIPSRGIINFHPAPLPDYKGTGGYNIAVLEGLSQWAVSAHYVDEHIDTGRIIHVDRFEIDPQTETARSLEATCRHRLQDLFLSVTAKALQTPSLLPSVENQGGRYISRAEMEAMKAIRPGDDIERKIRAFWFPPYDGAYLEMGEQRYTLVNRHILNELADPEASSLFTKEAK